MRSTRPSVRALLLLLTPALLMLANPASNAAGLVTATTLDRRIAHPAVVESSGLARSTYARALLWTHNDSGGGPQVYGVSKSGETRAVLTLDGVKARDWEDITTGPGHTIWVGDVGDNARSRDVISVHRFTEPQALESKTISSTRFDLRYPDGRHDAEGIMVHPETGRLYVVTKSKDGGAIYRAPSTLSTSSVNVLSRVAPAPVVVTGASFAPDGRGFVLCNYGTAYLYGSFGDTPVRVDKPTLKQGESVEINRGGGALFMGSEGSDSPVYRVELPADY